MDVESCCRLRAGSVVWQAKPGRWILTVACKATYRLLPVESPLAEQQEDLNEEDSYWNDEETRSLSSASDLAPFKARADVLLVGHAFAPNGQPVRAVSARLCLGELDKAIEVWCDRKFLQDGRLQEGARFTKMPLLYERAAGGSETTNPVGLRFDAPPDMYGMVAVPNLQPPGRHVAWRGDTFEPIGFGPIAPSWPGRSGRLSTHSAGWSHRRWYERPLPEDVDSAYFNAAPQDQQVNEIRPNERIVLEGLHPEHPRLVTSLVEVRPHAVVERPGQVRQAVALKCDTLWIDTDRSLCTLVWRGQVGLQRQDEAGRVVVTAEGTASHEAARAGAQAAAAMQNIALAKGAGSGVGGAGGAVFRGMQSHQTLSPSAADSDDIGTVVPSYEQRGSAAQAPATPFIKREPVEGGSHSHQGSGALKAGGEPIAPPPLFNVPRSVAQPPMLGPLAGAVGHSAAVSHLPATPPSHPNVDGVNTATGPILFIQDPLPFKPRPSSEEPPVRGDVRAKDASISTDSDGEEITLQTQDRSAPVFQPGQASIVEATSGLPFSVAPNADFTSRAFSAGALSSEAPVWDVASPSEPKPPEEVSIAQSPEPPPPPPMIGPLARAGMESLHPTQNLESQALPAPVDALSKPTPAPPRLVPADFAIEKCAAITASIARRRDEESKILDEHELDPSAWKAIKAHWTEAIRKETSRGKRELLRKYDWAYIEQLEKERGPIQASEYALLTLASECGETDDVLASFTLPHGALIRIERVWIERMAKDATLRESVQRFVEALRES